MERSDGVVSGMGQNRPYPERWVMSWCDETAGGGFQVCLWL